MENRLEEAREYISDALLYNGMDKNIYRTAAVIARLRGDREIHEMLLKQILEIDPLSHFAAFEKYYSKQDTETRNSFNSRITGELNFETYIELALWYYNARLLREAYAVMENCPEVPVADYLTAYIAFLRNDTVKSQFYLQRALNADDRFVFPYREEYADILAWANRQETSWKTKRARLPIFSNLFLMEWKGLHGTLRTPIRISG